MSSFNWMLSHSQTTQHYISTSDVDKAKKNTETNACISEDRSSKLSEKIFICQPVCECDVTTCCQWQKQIESGGHNLWCFCVGKLFSVPPLFCSDPPFEGALSTQEWTQKNCANIGLLFVPMITTTSGNWQRTGMVQQFGIYFCYFTNI